MNRFSEKYFEILIFWSKIASVFGSLSLFVSCIYDIYQLEGWASYLDPLYIVVSALTVVVYGLLYSAAFSFIFCLSSLPFLMGEERREERMHLLLLLADDLRSAAVASAIAVYFVLLVSPWLDRHGVFWISGGKLYICVAIGGVCLFAALGRRIVWYLSREPKVATNDGEPSVMSRRIIMGTGAAAVAMATASAATAVRRPRPSAAAVTGRPNILLVTFDALAAEDMSLYGYPLATTPRIDAYSKDAAVFTNFFSCGTFTQAGISSILTGRHPSETKAYQLGSRLRGADMAKTLPKVLQDAGYNTAAVFGNPWAYPLMAGTRGAFDVLKEAEFRLDVMLMNEAVRESPASGDLIKFELDFVDGLSEFIVPGLANETSRFTPARTFAEAEQVLGELRPPYFLWVHVLAPHSPYLPSPTFRHRFLKPKEFESRRDMMFPVLEAQAAGDPAALKQSFDQIRLRYNEWIAEADDAFGQFFDRLQAQGRLDDTAVVISADHGESFEGGTYRHGGDKQLRQLVHIPLIVRRPGQREGRRIPFTADQTSIAPTILDLAGVAAPAWMSAPSLAPMVDLGGDGGVAFTQCLDTNSCFKPISRGSVGVILGEYQYVVDVRSGHGALFHLSEAFLQDHDRSAEFPELAGHLRSQIRARFPEIAVRLA